MGRKSATFAQRRKAAPSSHLSRNPHTVRARTYRRRAFGLQVAFDRATTNARTQKARARKRLRTSEGWDALPEETQKRQIEDACTVIDLNLEDRLKELELGWEARLMGEKGELEGDEDGISQSEGEKMAGGSGESEHEEESTDKEMEIGDVDADDNEVYVDKAGQVIGQDAVESSLEALMHERGKAIREMIDMFEAAGSYDEEPYVSSDTGSDEGEDFVEDE